jgi:serine/threonine protein phosphatase PrpC
VKAEPEISQFQIAKNHDFIVLGSDGIFDKLSDEDIGKSVWMSCQAAKTQLQSGKEFAIPGTVAGQQNKQISVH